MAPEQFDSSKKVTARSDLYALGLVLYEMFTGQHPFGGDNRNRDDWKDIHTNATPEDPSVRRRDLRPWIGKLILRCLQKRPDDRPGRARAVADRLGSDRLAEAVRREEMLTPVEVAVGGPEGSLHPVHWILLIFFLVDGCSASALLADEAKLFRKVPLHENPPEALEFKARTVLAQLGYTAPERYSNSRFYEDEDYLDYVRKCDRSPTRWDALKSGQPAAMYFWYVQSPQPFDPTRAYFPEIPGRVTPSDPPLRGGMASVFLDLKGRLIEFQYVPRPEDESHRRGGDPWPTLFAAAGLDQNAFQSAIPRWTPPGPCDQQKAWKGFFPEQSGTELQIEAASYQGRPVFFRMIGPWSKPERIYRARGFGELHFGELLALVYCCLALCVTPIFVWHHWREGELDGGGALRVAACVSILYLLIWGFVAKHAWSFEIEMRLFWPGLGNALGWSVTLGLAYLAFEPYIRRRRPWQIVSWQRVLRGRRRDPLVGKHILIGGAFGVIVSLLLQMNVIMPKWLGLLPPVPGRVHPASFGVSIWDLPYRVLVSITDSILDALVSFLLLFLLVRICDVIRRTEVLWPWRSQVSTERREALKILLGDLKKLLKAPRKDLPALLKILLGDLKALLKALPKDLPALILAFVIAIGSWFWNAELGYPWVTRVIIVLSVALSVALGLILAWRWGVFPLAVMFFFYRMLSLTPLTFDLSAWYFRASTFWYLVCLGVVVIFGIIISRPQVPIVDSRPGDSPTSPRRRSTEGR